MAEYNGYEQECINNLKKCINTYKKYPNNFVVDIGASYNSWFLDFPYQGILIEADMNKIIGRPPTGLYRTLCKRVTPDNICDILKQNNTPKDFYILNIDIDGCDLFVMMALLKQYRPKIIITEINEKIPYPVRFSIRPTPNFDWGWCHLYGYSIGCLEDLMTMYNYSIDSLCYNNVILIRNEEGEKPNIDQIETVYKEGYLNNKVIPVPSWNDDVKHLHDCKTKEEVAEKWREYFINNPNPNNGKPHTNIDNYVINDSYNKYLNEFLKTI